MKSPFFVKVHYHNGGVVTATYTTEIIAVAGHGFKMKVPVHHAISWRELGLRQLLKGLDSAPNSLISLTNAG
jgi:hypothetical protein